MNFKSKLLHFLKKAWLPMACFLIALVRFIINPVFSMGHLMLALITALYVLMSLNPEKTRRMLRWKYNKDYAEFVEFTSRLLLGAAALTAAFLI